MEKQKTAGQQLAETLLFDYQHVADTKPDAVQECTAFCEDYKAFMNAAKTEREFVCEAVTLLEAAGYTEYEPAKAYKPGDKVYFNNRGKALMMTTFGTAPLEEGVHINIAHIDSPRLDLKARPLYEDSELALFKTHYYGGIRKYQWTAIPLAIHGVFAKADGTVQPFVIGEDETDPVFCVTDLLPHLGHEQDKRTLGGGIKGEELNVLVGSLPYEDKELKDRVKLFTLKLLNEKYGITEKDFVCAEIEVVPANRARDLGFDRSMIGAYGHDDKVCAYTAMRAELDTKQPKYTTVTCFADKEEIGSDGNTGLNSAFLFHYLQFLAEGAGADYKKLIAHARCLSADVNAALDPTFPSVNEKNNVAHLGRGVVVTKYTGSGGKYGTSDASAETMAYFTGMLDRHNVCWQTGELGKVDAGGGGTVAKYVANQNIDVVDIGVPLLSMHSPFEVASKLDVYMCYQAFFAFLTDEY